MGSGIHVSRECGSGHGARAVCKEPRGHPGEGKRVPKRNKVCVGAKTRGLSFSVLPDWIWDCDLGLDLMEGVMYH